MENSTTKVLPTNNEEEPQELKKLTALEWVDKERHNGKDIFWKATLLISNKKIMEAAIILTDFLETEIYKDVYIQEYISKKIASNIKYFVNQPPDLGHVRDIMYRLKDAILNERELK